MNHTTKKIITFKDEVFNLIKSDCSYRDLKPHHFFYYTIILSKNLNVSICLNSLRLKFKNGKKIIYANVEHEYVNEENKRPESNKEYDISVPNDRRDFFTKFFLNAYSIPRNNMVLKSNIIDYDYRIYEKVTTKKYLKLRKKVKEFHAYASKILDMYIPYILSKKIIIWAFYCLFYNDYSNVGVIDRYLAHLKKLKLNHVDDYIVNYYEIMEMDNNEIIDALLKHDPNIQFKLK